MKFHALVLIGSATLLTGCADQVSADCDAATRTGEEFQKCIKDSYREQYKAHRKVVKEYMAES